MKFKHLFFLVLLCVTLETQSQDLIYSQFNSMPMAINPAFAGNNACNYRLSAIGRSQWMGVENVTSYKSANVGFDFNLNNVNNEQVNLWGLGFMGSYDQAGDGKFSNLKLLTNIAYHLRFGSEANNFLSFGVQGGVYQKSIKTNELLFDDQLDDFGRIINSNTTDGTIETQSKWYPDINFGGLLTLNPSEITNIYIGSSIYHLLNPDISFTNVEYKIPTRYNVHAGGNFILGNFLILPSVYFQHQQLVNYNVGSYVGIPITGGDERTNPVIGYLGAWYKSTDAIAAAFRLDFSTISVGLSYDYHIGNISRNLSGVGSPEISINYYGCFNRNSRRMGCPML